MSLSDVSVRQSSLITRALRELQELFGKLIRLLQIPTDVMHDPQSPQDGEKFRGVAQPLT